MSDVIGAGLIWTLLLGVAALLINFALGHLLDMIGAWQRVGSLANVAPSLMILARAFPSFFLALTAVYFLGMQLNIIPTSHAHTAVLLLGLMLEFVGSVLEHLLMPANLIVLANDYITMAAAKDLRQNRFMYNYAALSALLPSVTGFGVFLGFVLSSQVLIEQAFANPGPGFLLVGAVDSRDFPLMQGLFLMITTAVLVANFLVDVLYMRLEERVRGEIRVCFARC